MLAAFFCSSDRPESPPVDDFEYAASTNEASLASTLLSLLGTPRRMVVTGGVVTVVVTVVVAEVVVADVVEVVVVEVVVEVVVVVVVEVVVVSVEVTGSVNEVLLTILL